MTQQIKDLHNAILVESNIEKKNFLFLKLNIAIEKYNQHVLVKKMKYIHDKQLKKDE